MEEINRLPKNIRQIGEKEERVRVYLEDYVYTYIHKMQSTKGLHAGILLGRLVTAENRKCWFIKGAAEIDGIIDDNKIGFSKETCKAAEKEAADYFKSCDICGWFIQGSEEAFPDREALKKLHREVFPGEDCLMYWQEGAEDSFWMEENKALSKLKGYYVYYERNLQMQSYMISREPVHTTEGVDDKAARNFRRIMNGKRKLSSKERELRRRQLNIAGKAAAAASIFIATVFILGKLAGNTSTAPDISDTSDTSAASQALHVKETVDALAAGALVERETMTEAESTEEDTVPDTVNANDAEEKFTENSQCLTPDIGASVYKLVGRSKRPEKYTVQPGDTLITISQKFYGTSDMVMKICEANDLENVNKIYIGQQLNLP